MWEKWFEAVRLAITAKANIQVEKLLRPKPQNAELDYPHEPMYEPPTSDETTAEKRPCGRRQSPYVDKIPWEEADTKIKSRVYLSLGQEATNIFHQRNPHTEMSPNRYICGTTERNI